jgi:uncharacterized protein (DUF2252 family)
VPTAGIVPEARSLERAWPELLAKLRNDTFAYFRFVNKPWAVRVCDEFKTLLPAFPTVRLHGDAHLEQYALTNEAYGLDDFDDSARGPSVIDLVRFLGSVDLAARRKGWTSQLDAVFDRFFEGYRRGLKDPHYLPYEPAVVRRLRARPARTQAEFLAWGESLMEPMSRAEHQHVTASFERFSTYVRRVRTDLPPGFFTVKQMGWLHMGVGSALTTKVLLRVEGRSPDPEDDVLIEEKEIRRLEGIACLKVSRRGEGFRVIAGARQLGRIHYDVLAVIPRQERDAPEIPNWWLRSWDPSYVELTVNDLNSVTDLAEVVHDVGAQLGATNLRRSNPALEAQLRQAELAAVSRFERRIRKEACILTDELIVSWECFRQKASQ